MTSRQEVVAAERGARQQRYEMRELLHVNERLATPADIELANNIRSAPTPAALDDYISGPAVADLFRRGVFYFGDVR